MPPKRDPLTPSRTAGEANRSRARHFLPTQPVLPHPALCILAFQLSQARLRLIIEGGWLDGWQWRRAHKRLVQKMLRRSYPLPISLSLSSFISSTSSSSLPLPLSFSFSSLGVQCIGTVSSEQGSDHEFFYHFPDTKNFTVTNLW